MKWKLKNGKGVTVEIGKNGKVLVNKKTGCESEQQQCVRHGFDMLCADADKREQFCSTIN